MPAASRADKKQYYDAMMMPARARTSVYYVSHSPAFGTAGILHIYDFAVSSGKKYCHGRKFHWLAGPATLKR